MPITIPQSVFDKYYDVVDSTFNIFGVTCQLVYIEKVEVIDNTYDNIPDNRSINPHRRPGGGNYRRNNKTIKEVEKIEDIKMKVYWDSKNWTKVSDKIVIPQRGIQTIFFGTDLPKVLNAKEIIVHKTIKDLSEFRFQRSGEPFPMGIGQERYFGCFWE
jgi:hypothetical protein|tara:strand:+ start:280 stop:756 length:477 start_codon:yes stop_codon:yes gene_type:complete